MTQGDPLPLTILNVVMDTVVQHWESLVTESSGKKRDDDEAGQTVAGRMIWGRDDGQRKAEERHVQLKVKAAFLYADDRMVSSTDPVWLQTAFNTPTGIFNRVGLQKNVRKTVGMVC